MCFLRISEQAAITFYTKLTDWFLQPRRRVFNERYELGPYIKQICFVFKGLIRVLHMRTASQGIPVVLQISESRV
jgi:hypothetical protein